MKLVTFTDAAGTRIGIAVDGGIVDLKKADPDLPRDMIGLMTQWPAVRGAVERAATRKADVAQSAVKLEAPVPAPGKNPRDRPELRRPHRRKRPTDADRASLVRKDVDARSTRRSNRRATAEGLACCSTTKPNSSPSSANAASTCRRTKRTRSSSAIAPATTSPPATGSSKPRNGSWAKASTPTRPFGPWIVTPDEIGDPHALGIRAFVNGEKRQDSNTKHLVFNIFDQIAHVSKAMTLEPGDLIFTGTPGGVGVAMKPPQFLKAGDVTRIEIDKIGAIEATVVGRAMIETDVLIVGLGPVGATLANLLGQQGFRVLAVEKRHGRLSPCPAPRISMPRSCASGKASGS